MAAAGLAAGLVLAGGAARLMGSLLYEVKPLDPATYLEVTRRAGGDPAAGQRHPRAARVARGPHVKMLK